jgi:hypothetical protein
VQLERVVAEVTRFVQPDHWVGASVGSWISALRASGKTAEQTRQIVASINVAQLGDPRGASATAQRWHAARHGGLYAGVALEEAVRASLEQVGCTSWSDLEYRDGEQPPELAGFDHRMTLAVTTMELPPIAAHHLDANGALRPQNFTRAWAGGGLAQLLRGEAPPPPRRQVFLPFDSGQGIPGIPEAVAEERLAPWIRRSAAAVLIFAPETVLDAQRNTSVAYFDGAWLRNEPNPFHRFREYPVAPPMPVFVPALERASDPLKAAAQQSRDAAFSPYACTIRVQCGDVATVEDPKRRSHHYHKMGPADLQAWADTAEHEARECVEPAVLEYTEFMRAAREGCVDELSPLSREEERLVGSARAGRVLGHNMAMDRALRMELPDGLDPGGAIAL